MNKNTTLIKFINNTKNSYSIGKPYYITEYSNFVERILYILLKEGFIKYFYKKWDLKNKKFKLHIFLNFKQYNDKGAYYSVIKNIKISTKLKDKMFLKKNELFIFNNYSIIILSTNLGLMSHLDAMLYGIGGKVIMYIE